MTRLFVATKEFDKLWKSIGFSEEDIIDLENELIKNPHKGSVISGTNGLRKLRWALKGKGKSSGIRILYVDFQRFEQLHFISLLKKNEKSNITKGDKKIISNLILELQKYLEQKFNETKKYQKQ